MENFSYSESNDKICIFHSDLGGEKHEIMDKIFDSEFEFTRNRFCQARQRPKMAAHPSWYHDALMAEFEFHQLFSSPDYSTNHTPSSVPSFVHCGCLNFCYSLCLCLAGNTVLHRCGVLRCMLLTGHWPTETMKPTVSLNNGHWVKQHRPAAILCISTQ